MPVRIPAVPGFVLLVLGLAVLAPAHAAEIGGSEGNDRLIGTPRADLLHAVAATTTSTAGRAATSSTAASAAISSSQAWATTGSQSTTTPSATQCSVAAATTW